ncbi:DUF2878 domain-containing protein [Aeromonas veronii]|uniref:DUF2878 domain-containing protein n=2 Tax=Aeromonas veronii TaxID=654 RepID=UPI001933947B|nr:DUF2878 domain-containing protein [Aeromonas veronii]MBM0419203.1 DUF2878 family protein [Aeromonas veronii]MBW3790515.1 DUF2878 domain-containing protein [Aeromonas veronii]
MWQWAHLLGFNLYWLLAVKWQQPGPLLAMLLLHFLFSPSRLRDWRLLPIAVVGCLLDALLWQLGLFRFPSGFPLWLVLLWLGFALTLAHGMRWLLRLPCWQQALFGVFGGASSYVAGAAMGAVHLPWGIWISTALLAVIWMWWLPVLLWVMVKLEGES